MKINTKELSDRLQQQIEEELADRTPKQSKTLVDQMGYAFRKLMNEHITFGDIAAEMKRANPSLTDRDLRTSRRQYAALVQLFHTLAPMRSYMLEDWYDRIVDFTKDKHFHDAQTKLKNKSQLEFDFDDKRL